MKVGVATETSLREEQSGVFRLPVLEVGHGDRRDDCENYDGCLDRFVARTRGAVQGRCPKGCESFRATPSHVRHALAHAYGQRPTPSAL